MSFEEQERALFDLLFDRTLRKRFCEVSIAALGEYELSQAERDDLAVIGAEAIELDATMRAHFILSQICRSFPLTFSIVSSLADGLETLKGLIDTQTMRTPPVERALRFGTRLSACLTERAFASAKEKHAVMALAELELSMAWTGAALKTAVLTTGVDESHHPPRTNGSFDGRIKLADYVCLGLVPQPYAQLKRSLCPCVDTELWKHLSRHPLTAHHRHDILQREAPRLMLARAYVGRMSRCEPVVEYRTAELAAGFAHLFEHLNGATSADEILTQLKQTGASAKILESVRGAFQQLLANGMLVLV